MITHGRSPIRWRAGLNCFELIYAVMTVGGAGLGAIAGAAQYGFLGGAGGLLAGALIGFVASQAILFCIAVAAKIVLGGPMFPPKRTPSSNDDKTRP